MLSQTDAVPCDVRPFGRGVFEKKERCQVHKGIQMDPVGSKLIF